MATTSGSSSPKWALTHVHIENFKSYNLVDKEIQQKGMTGLTGANGAGKSVFLEAIAFGLGASPGALRIQTLAELCGSHSAIGNRTEVLLTFKSTKHQDTILVGSAITNGSRVYFLNNKAVTKQAFFRTTNETLGFPNNCSTYYLSQRAIDLHIKAQPQALFKFLCFLAGTDALLSAQEDASRQITIFEKHLREVVAAVKHLEEDVQQKQHRLERLNDEALIAERLAQAESETKSAENRHRNAKRFRDLDSCMSLVTSLTLLYEAERSLVQRLKHRQQEETETHWPESTGEELLQNALLRLEREESQLKKHASSLAALFKTGQESAAALEELRHQSTRNGAERQRILSTSIPQLIARISSSNTSPGTNDDAL
jgi:DNA repair ATPase RecN